MNQTHFSDRRTPFRPDKLHDFAQSKNTPVSRVETLPKQRRGYRSTSGSEVCLFKSNSLQSEMMLGIRPMEEISKASRPQSFAQLRPSKIMRQQEEVLDLGSDGEVEVEKKDRQLMSSSEIPNHPDMVRVRSISAERAVLSAPNEYVNNQEISSAPGIFPHLYGTKVRKSLAGIDLILGRTEVAAKKLPLDQISSNNPELRQNRTDIQTADMRLPSKSSVARQQIVSPIRISSASHLDKRRTTEDVISNESGTVKRKCIDDENDEHIMETNHIAKNDLKVTTKDLVSNIEAPAKKTNLLVPSHTSMKSTEIPIASKSSSKETVRISQDESSQLSPERDPIAHNEPHLEQKLSIRETQVKALKGYVKPKVENVLSSSCTVSDKCDEYLSTANFSKSQDPNKGQTPFIPHDDGQSLFVQESSDEDKHGQSLFVQGISDEDDHGSKHARNNDINSLQPVTLPGKKKEIQGIKRCTAKGQKMSKPLCKTPMKVEDNKELSQRQQDRPSLPNSKGKNSQDPKALIQRDSDNLLGQRPRSKQHHVEPRDIKEMRQFRKILKARRRLPVVFTNDNDCTANGVSSRSDEVERLTARKVDEKSAEKMRDPVGALIKENYTVKHAKENGEVQSHPDESSSGDAQSKSSVNTITSKRVDEKVIATKSAERNELNSRASVISAGRETVEVSLYAFDCNIIILICFNIKSKAPTPSSCSANQDAKRIEPLEGAPESSSGAKHIADEPGVKGENIHGPFSASSPSATIVSKQFSKHAEKHAHNNPSGHNSAHDRLIFELRGKRKTWKEVQQIFEGRTGRHLSFKVLRNRYKVAAHYFEKNVEGQKENAYFGNTEPVLRKTSDLNPVTGIDPSKIEGESSRNEIIVQPFTNHAVTGTKSWNNKVFQAYLRTMADEAANNDEEEDADEDDEAKAVEALAPASSNPWREPTRPESPATSEDICYWEYQIKRKNWLAGDANEDLDYDSEEVESLAEWTVVGSKTYSSLQQANYAAGQEVFRERYGCALGPEIRQWTYRLNEDDMAEYYGSSHDNRRYFKVIVDRFLRNPTSGLLPETKTGWLSKRVYEIKQRIFAAQAVSEGVEISGKSNEEMETLLPVPVITDEEVLDGLYTILDQANREAGRMILNMMTKPDSSRIDDQIYRVEAQKQMREKLDQLEVSNTTFSETAVLPDNRKIMIWVEQRQLKGPRNI